MVDELKFNWFHLAAVIISNIFVAGVTYGAVEAKLSDLNRRMDATDLAQQATSKRIDDIFTLLTKR